MTVFQGLVAVCVSQNGPTLYRPSLLEKSTTIDESSLGRRKSLIVSYWMSDTISSKNGCRIAWNIACNDSKVYCWSVPCTNKDSSHFYLSSAERKVRQNLTISQIIQSLFIITNILLSVINSVIRNTCQDLRNIPSLVKSVVLDDLLCG